MKLDFKGIANWLLSGVVWAAGTTLTAFQIVPGMDWKSALTLAGSTYVAALVQHLRDHPFVATPPVK